MAAVTELPGSAVQPSARTELPAAPLLRRRAVAVSASPMELLRPESDLARLIQGFAHVDLLVAVDDPPLEAPGCVEVLSGVESPADEARAEPGDPGGESAGPRPDPSSGGDSWDGESWDGDSWDGDSWDGTDDPEDDEDAAVPDEEVTRLGLPGLHLHRLGLRPPLGPLVEADLVAALSELVGFDPEPGVCCIAPAPTDVDPDRAVIDEAVQRIVGVYGLPLLRYRCLELSVVTPA